MPDAYRLPSIPYLRLRVAMRAEAEAALPEYHGSMLRGAFGHALRRTVCTMGPAQPCGSCQLRRACVYTRIFETFVEDEPPPFLRGVDQAVRPYVFEPRGGGERLPPGGSLGFDLLLFGQAIELQAYAVLALERMARGGLGAGRARFELVRIEALDPAGAPRALFAEGAATRGAPVAPSVPADSPLPEGAVTLRFVTPLRIKVRHQLTDRPRFRDLAFHMLRRALEMAHWHVPGAAVDWEFYPLLQKCEEVRVASADLRWLDWERWSQRQNAAMKLGGLVGTLTLEGDVAPFTPLLRAAEVLHAGKGATFGLGKVEVETPSRRDLS
jgi:hypothetical protein